MELDDAYWDGLLLHTEQLARQRSFPQNIDRWGNNMPDLPEDPWRE